MRSPSSELETHLEAAFDYRGDITLAMKSGEELVGFLFNREFAPHASLSSTPFVELALPSGQNRKLTIESIQGVVLSGEDHAAPSA